MQKADLKFSELPFSYVPTDYNIRYHCKDGEWDKGTLTKDVTMPMHISATCLHYGQQVFEGLKAYERPDGKAQLFRIEENAKRMNRGAEKLLMQTVPEELFVEAVIKVVNANRRFIPPHGIGATLYIRPILLGTGINLGVSPSDEFTFIVFVSPVGPYYKSGFTPVHLIVEENVDRAASLGVGDVKVAGNYAAGMRATFGAKKKGYNEVLYLDSKEKLYLDESGSSNFFGVSSDGGTYLTPKSSSVLPSITNMSVMDIAESLGMKVERRAIHVNELAGFSEAGCCGTAAVISPVGSVTHGEKKFTYCKDNTVGPVCTNLYNELSGIQFGEIEDKFGWTRLVPEE